MHLSIGKATAQHQQVVKVSTFGKLNQLFLDSAWLFHAGELPGDRAPFNTLVGWRPVYPTFFGNTDAPKGWTGMGWFGLWFRVDTTLVNKKLYISINHDGASELYMDGKPIGGYGTVGNSATTMQAIRAPREVIPVWFADTRPHLLSLRYSNFFGVYADFYGFQVSVGQYEQRAKRMAHAKVLIGYLPMFGAAQLILGLLHFLYFLFYPRQKLNAYYSFFVMVIGINNFAIYHFYLTPYPEIQYLTDFLTAAFKVAIMWGAVMLLYVFNYKTVPKWRGAILSVIALTYLIKYSLQFWVYRSGIQSDYFSLIYLICITDGLWSAAQVIRRKQKGAWLIGIGVIAITLIYFFAWGDVFSLWQAQYNNIRLFVMGAGSLILPLCLSLYLALDFATTNQRLAGKLREVETLSAEAMARESEKRELIATEARRLELLVQQRTAELQEQAIKLKDLDAAKSRFFANITHEFRTPLTLIINPARQSLEVPGSDDTRNLQLILNNAERLLQLINQLLDLSKLENNVMTVDLAPVDVVELAKRDLFSFEPLAAGKNISLKFSTDAESLWVMTDQDKLNKILLNILSNAFKFTNEGSIELSLKLREADNLLSITITDTGKGIPADKLPFVFSRFYQADPSDTRSAEGTGIGLSLTKELIDLLGGEIIPESVEGVYTRMRIKLPCELASIANSTTEKIESEDISTELVYDTALIANGSSPLLLLIEDNKELRDFIRQSLSSNYRLITAADGEEGINMALSEIPNLIISDLMMPKVSGYEVCSTLKNNEKTSHIPIIILTAKSGIDSRLRGIDHGADAYLGKPFDERELLALIKNLINMREQLRLHYSQRDLWFKDTTGLPSIEQAFITKVRKAVEAHMNEEGYTADQLATDIGLSRTQLSRKLKDLIGQAPGELIRTVRLQYAHELLMRRAATIAEVAYMVGFSSPTSFSASFSRHFGFPPKQVNSY